MEFNNTALVIIYVWTVLLCIGHGHVVGYGPTHGWCEDGLSAHMVRGLTILTRIFHGCWLWIMGIVAEDWVICVYAACGGAACFACHHIGKLMGQRDYRLHIATKHGRTT